MFSSVSSPLGMHDVRRLAPASIAVFQRHAGNGEGVDLPYRESLLTELTARIDGASGADMSAQAARVAVPVKQREVRELSARFHEELVSFRLNVARGARVEPHRVPAAARRGADGGGASSNEQSQAASAVTSNGASRPSAAS